ncbi:MAG: hypothetical protein WCK26_01285 [Candidatus Saccharibacteria bacterium]
MKDMLLLNPKRILMRIIGRYNLVIFIILLTAGLIASILILNNIIISTGTSTSTNTSTDISGDQITINSLNKLEASADNSNFQNLPSGRINPFSE